MMTMNIQGKVVVITGASSGVGESTARLLAGNGAKVVLGARRKDRIDTVVKDITAKGGSALGFKTDVTRRDDVEALVRGAMDRYDRIDVIVNNSGIMPIAPMAALKVMASVFGIKVFAPGATVYCATKSAVRALTEGLRMELHTQTIRCTMISPGAVATELPESSSEEATRKNLREFYKMAIPADSIARAIAYAIEQPAEVEVDEIVIRPTAQDF
jgi:NADP-dependent 3-hydroxy acid dehydrogenase YdfG